MGAIFKKFCQSSYCSKCNIQFYQLIGAFSGIAHDQKKTCSKCNDELLSQQEDTLDFYLLRGTNIKLLVNSIPGKIFVFMPGFILWIITFIFFSMWLIEFFTSGYKSATITIYVDSMIRIFGAEWPGFILGLLTYYFIFQTVGFVYNIYTKHQ